MKVRTRPDTHSGREDSHGVSRRTVARGAAWATPVVLTAIAAPSYAAASGGVCTDKGSDLLDKPVGTKVTSLDFGNGVTAAVSITSRRGALGIPSAPDTGTIQTVEYSPSWNYLDLHFPAGMKPNDTMIVVLTFSKPVQNFTLTITDIDKDAANGLWIDKLWLYPNGTVLAKGPNVSGTGVSLDPFVANVDKEITSADGDATMTWPGPLTQLALTYVAADPKSKSANGQHIGIGRFSYDNCV